MNTGHFARADDILENAVRLEENMFAVDHLYLASHDGKDERQFGQAAIVQFGNRLDNLSEGRFLDEHGVEQTIGGIRFWVLTNTAAGERSITDVHGEESIVHRLFTVHI